MQPEPRWLAGLGLTQVAEGVWRHEETGLEVEYSPTFTGVQIRVGPWPIRSWGIRAWKGAPPDVQVSWPSSGGFVGSAIPDGVNGTSTRRFAAALNLAADIAEAYNAQRPETAQEE